MSTTSTPETDLEDRLQAFCAEQPDVRLAILFGSLAQREATDNHVGARFDSDLDLGVAGDAPLTPHRKKILIESLGTAFGRPVDLVDLQNAHGTLLRRVLTTGTLVYAPDRSLYATLIRRHLYEQADFMPYRRRILSARRQRWLDDE
jgi:predicted nucleotidyltransferase